MLSGTFTPLFINAKKSVLYSIKEESVINYSMHMPEKWFCSLNAKFFYIQPYV